MTRYLTIRKRNNKKYKKSRKGHTRRRRSVKRHTVGKRRRMVGGDDMFNFNVPPEDLKTTMSHYETYGSPFRHNYIRYVDDVDGVEKIKNGFKQVELVAYGFALVTKLDSMFSSKNRKEQISVFACYLPLRDGRVRYPNNDDRDPEDPFCYAIVRCAKTDCKDNGTTNRSKANYNMEDKILFLFISTRNKVNPDSSIVVQGDDETVKDKQYNVFEFTNKLSSDGDERYKILVDNTQDTLKDFFITVSIKTPGNQSKGSEHYKKSITSPIEDVFRKPLNLNQRDTGGSTGLSSIPFLL